MTKKAGESPATTVSASKNEGLADQGPFRLVILGSPASGKRSLYKRLAGDSSFPAIEQNRIPADVSSKSLGKSDYAEPATGTAREHEEGDWESTVKISCRPFNTGRRRWIVLDDSGNAPATGGLVAGASIADFAIILVDARQGVLAQTRRHALIASLMGIRSIALVVNKMDLVDYQQAVFDTLVGTFKSFSDQLHFTDLVAIPVSALNDDHINSASVNMPWFKGSYLRLALDSISLDHAKIKPFRFEVQNVYGPEESIDTCSGKILTGEAAPGDRIRILPSGELATIRTLQHDTSHLSTAGWQFLKLSLDKTSALARGKILTVADSPSESSDQFEVSLEWTGKEAGFIGRTYLLIVGSIKINATITDIKFSYNINTLEKLESSSLKQNDIGKATISVEHPIPFDTVEHCRSMGAIVLVDRYTYATVGVGRINHSLRRAQNVHRQAMNVNKAAREKLNGHPARVLWFTGLSGSGKSTIANAVEQALHEAGIRTYILDGDNVRHGLNRDLGFTDADRVENIRRIAEVAALMVDAGLVVLTAFISPFRSERDMARALFKPGEFIEIHIDVPLEIAEKRDPKGLYRKARKGELPNFTGIDSAYEKPHAAEIVLATGALSLEQCVNEVLQRTRLC